MMGMPKVQLAQLVQAEFFQGNVVSLLVGAVQCENILAQICTYSEVVSSVTIQACQQHNELYIFYIDALQNMPD